MAIETKPTMWGIHAGGEDFDGDIVFMNKKCIALSWGAAGDIRAWPRDRKSFKRLLQETHKRFPDITESRITAGAGALFRFLTEIEINDIVVYRSKWDDRVSIGIVESDYQFDTDRESNPNAPHIRLVNWYHPQSYFSDVAMLAASKRQALWKIEDIEVVREFLKALKQAKREADTPIQG